MEQANFKRHKWLFYVIATVFVICPFVISYTSENGEIYTPMIALSPQHLEMEKGLIAFLGILFFIIAATKKVTVDKSKRKTSLAFAIFFALCVVFGNSFKQIASWNYIFSSFSGFVASLCTTVGYAIAFYYMLGCLFTFIDSYDKIAVENDVLNKFSKGLNGFFEKKSLIKMWLILLICWLPYIVINYPAVIHADSGVMLSEYINHSLYNHHPVLQTIVWGSFVDFGKNVFNSYNFGVFLFAFVQYLYGTFAVALLFDYMYKKKYPVLCVFAMLMVVAIMPAFPRYGTAVCKDSNFTFFVLFMVWLMFKTIDVKNEIWDSNKYRPLLILWFIAVLFVGFSRKSGIHIVILTAPFLIFYLRKSKKAMISVLISILLGISIYFVGQYFIANVFDIGSDDTKETYAIPFQQTARFVKEYGEDVEPEDAEIINRILDYNALAEKYNPELVDPVKNTFNFDSTKEDFNAYLGVWFKQFFVHPTVYLQATLNNIYGYFYPEDVGYYKDLFFETQCVNTDNIYPPEALVPVAKKFLDIDMKSRNLPVIGLFSSLGFWIWIDLFIMAYFVLYKRDKRFAVYNLPAIITILICIASPANNTMRYGLPVMFIAPVLICACFKGRDDELIEKEV